MNAIRQSVTVLVADDDDDDRGLIKRAWDKSHQYDDLRFGEDGEELTQYLGHAGRYSDPVLAPPPSVILRDLNMPRKDGHEALREIKANPDLRQIPMVILTPSKADEDIVRSYDLGANSYITKPVRFAEMVDVLRVVGKYWTEVVNLPQGVYRAVTTRALVM